MTTYKVINALLKNKDGDWISPHTADTLKKNQITNCITEIPQRIKLELNNGTLTLKAGSELTYGDGRTIVIGNDLSGICGVNATLNNLILICEPQANSFGIYIQGSNATSGTTPPTIATGTVDYIWLDTNTNQMKISHDTQATWREIPLPIGVVDITPYAYTALKQVFNGFGYIGQCTFVDKGVKALFADGRNEDGTLKNVERVTTTVNITNLQNQTSILSRFDGNNLWGYGVNAYYVQDTKPTITGQHAMWFSPSENYLYITGDNGVTWGKNLGIVGELTKTDATGSITGMFTFQPFRAVDYSEFEEATKDVLKQPKGTGGEVTVGNGWVATGNGLIRFIGYSDSKGNNVTFTINGSWVHQNTQSGSNANHHSIAVTVPIYKGQVVGWSGNGATSVVFIPYV